MWRVNELIFRVWSTNRRYANNGPEPEGQYATVQSGRGSGVTTGDQYESVGGRDRGRNEPPPAYAAVQQSAPPEQYAVVDKTKKKKVLPVSGGGIQIVRLRMCEDESRATCRVSSQIRSVVCRSCDVVRMSRFLERVSLHCSMLEAQEDAPDVDSHVCSFNDSFSFETSNLHCSCTIHLHWVVEFSLGVPCQFEEAWNK